MKEFVGRFRILKEKLFMFLKRNSSKECSFSSVLYFVLRSSLVLKKLGRGKERERSHCVMRDTAWCL